MWPVLPETLTNYKNRFIFVLGVDSGVFDWPTFEKNQIHHSENEEEKWRIFEILMHMRKMKYVPSPEIMPNPKIPHPSPGDVCLVFQGMQKGHGHYQKYVTDRGFCL